ncbi:MAG: PA0069 family radical SAM protein [Polyangiales bacterium]
MPRAVENPPNPWHGTHVEYLDAPPPARLEVFEDHARSILARNDSPDIPFRWSLNPYRGCMHACAYCYARPSHQHLGFGAGTDFDRKIVVKRDAPALLREAFAKRSWVGEAVMFSGNTDCYQPLEASYGLTRACLEVCAEHRNPVCVITKSALVRRDADVLAKLARESRARVIFSVPFARDEDALKIEPWAARVSRRFEAMRALSDAGVPVGVSVSPVIPGLNDHDIAEVLERAAAAGASSAFMIALRLPGEVREVFQARLAEAFPDRAARVMSQLVDIRRGRTDEARFGARMRGEGARWEIVRQLFHTTARRLGLDGPSEIEAPGAFKRPSAQGELF